MSSKPPLPSSLHPPSPLRLTASHAAPRERVHRQGREGVHLEGGEDIRPVPLRMVCPLPTATRHATSRIARQPFATRHTSLASCSCLLLLPLALASCLSPLARRTVCAASVVPRAPLHAAPHPHVAHLAVPHIAVLTAPSCSARTRSTQRQRLRRVVRADNGQRTRRAGRDQGSWVRGICAEGAASD